MKLTYRLLLIFTLSLTVFSQRTTASAADTFKFSGESAQTTFSTIDGCILTEVGVLTSEGIFKSPPGKGNPTSEAFLIISQVDLCTDTYIFFANGSAQLADTDFQVSGKLESATLNTTVSVFDQVSQTFLDVFVDLAWTGVGPLSRESTNFHSKSPGCKVHSRFKGTLRFAEASGSVSDGTTNFTPDPAIDARIFSTKSGDVVIGCN